MVKLLLLEFIFITLNTQDAIKQFIKKLRHAHLEKHLQKSNKETKKDVSGRARAGDLPSGIEIYIH